MIGGNKMRFVGYTGISAVLTAIVIVLAMVERPNFYSACVAISQSGASMIIMINMALILTLLTGKVIQLIFFGELRALELEHLYERLWYAVTETGLAMMVFKDSFNLQFGAAFTLLIFLRVFHWIASDRVDLIFQVAQAPSTSAKIRLASALLSLFLSDLYLLNGCVSEVLTNIEKRPSISIMFAFEFALLFNTVISSCGRYTLNLAEARYLEANEDEDVWDMKGTWTFILEVFSDSVRLAIYMAFFVVMLQPYGLPLHIVRDVYITTSALVGRIRDYIRYRRARIQMDRAIANATEQELQQQEDICIICREEMSVDPNQRERLTPKKLACGHVIHYGCLKSWLERSQRCPTCRREVLEDGNAPAPTPTAVPPPGAGGLQVNNIQFPANNNTNHNNQAQQPHVQGGQPQAQQQPLLFPQGFQLPHGWTVLPARALDGNFEVQLNESSWAQAANSDVEPENESDDVNVHKRLDEMERAIAETKERLESVVRANEKLMAMIDGPEDDGLRSRKGKQKVADEVE